MIANSRPATEEEIKTTQDWLDRNYPGCKLVVDEKRDCYVVRPVDLFMKYSQERYERTRNKM